MKSTPMRAKGFCEASRAIRADEHTCGDESRIALGVLLRLPPNRSFDRRGQEAQARDARSLTTPPGAVARCRQRPRSRPGTRSGGGALPLHSSGCLSSTVLAHHPRRRPTPDRPPHPR